MSLQKELEAAYCTKTSLQKELAATYGKESLQPEELAAAYCNKTPPAFPVYLLGQTKARELQLNIAQLCKQDFAHQSFKRNELVAASLANQGLTAYPDHLLGQTKARELQLTMLRRFAATMLAQP